MGAVFGFALFAFILCLLPLAIAMAFNLCARMEVPLKYMLIAEILFVSVLHISIMLDSYELRYELLFGLFSHLCYLSNLTFAEFPSIDFYSKRSAISLVCFVVTHIIWFGYFSEVIREDPIDLIVYYVIMIWLVPLSIVLVGLPRSKFSDASTDHVLPMYNTVASSNCSESSSKSREHSASAQSSHGLPYSTSSLGNNSSGRSGNNTRCSAGSSTSASSSSNTLNSRLSSTGLGLSSRGLTGLAATSSSLSLSSQAAMGGYALRSQSRSNDSLPSAVVSSDLLAHTASIPRSLSFTDLLGGANSI